MPPPHCLKLSSDRSLVVLTQPFQQVFERVFHTQSRSFAFPTLIEAIELVSLLGDQLFGWIRASR